MFLSFSLATIDIVFPWSWPEKLIVFVDFLAYSCRVMRLGCKKSKLDFPFPKNALREFVLSKGLGIRVCPVDPSSVVRDMCRCLVDLPVCTVHSMLLSLACKYGCT